MVDGKNNHQNLVKSWIWVCQWFEKECERELCNYIELYNL